MVGYPPPPGSEPEEPRAEPPPRPGYTHHPPPGHAQAPQVIYVQPPATQKTNGFAIASLVLGIVWIYWIGSILALVFGYVARSQIRRSEGMQSGDGMAIAGIVLGWIGIGILVLLIVIGVGIGISGE